MQISHRAFIRYDLDFQRWWVVQRCHWNSLLIIFKGSWRILGQVARFSMMTNCFERRSLVVNKTPPFHNSSLSIWIWGSFFILIGFFPFTCWCMISCKSYRVRLNLYWSFFFIKLTYSALNFIKISSSNQYRLWSDSRFTVVFRFWKSKERWRVQF